MVGSGSLACCGADRGLGVGQQRRLVLLHRQYVVAAPCHNRFGHTAMAMQRIGRHHAAFELQKLDQLQCAGSFVVVRRLHVGQRHAGLRRPSGHHDRRHVALAAIVAAPQCFAVERDHSFRLFDLRAFRKGFHEALEGFLERSRIEHAEHAAERVVARRTMLEYQHPLPKIRLHPRKQRHVGATRCPTQRRHQGDEQNLRQIVQSIARARVRQFFEALRKSSHRPLHPNQELPSESISHGFATTYQISHAIPLPCRGRVGTHRAKRRCGTGWGEAADEHFTPPRRSFHERRPSPSRGGKNNYLCSLTPSITTVAAELDSGTLESRISRRTVPLIQMSRFSL